MLWSLLVVVTVLGTLGLGLTALYSGARGNSAQARNLGITALGVVGAYFVLLMLASLASRPEMLAMNEPKKFCAADCDLWFLVDKAEHFGGKYYVTIRVQSDAKRVTMTADHPTAVLVDERGNEYQPSGETDSLPFARPVPPGESYTKTFIFELPDAVKSPSLLISEGGWITRLIAGDENSFFHKKTLIRLQFSERY
jgi:hypothetical protein